VNVKGISHDLRIYEVVGDFKDIGANLRIEEEIGDFKVSLDPKSLDADSTQRAREALLSALAALDPSDKTQA
jgi:hypothetical protein